MMFCQLLKKICQLTFCANSMPTEQLDKTLINKAKQHIRVKFQSAEGSWYLPTARLLKNSIIPDLCRSWQLELGIYSKE